MLSPGCDPLLRTDPRKIDNYRIVGRLGAGGMATVYLAQADDADEGDGYVALKLVHEHLAADDEFRARFDREAQLAARIPAYCSAALLGTGAHDDRPYLVSEYLAGSPLHRLVEAEGPLDPGSLHNVAVGMAAGLTTIQIGALSSDQVGTLTSNQVRALSSGQLAALSSEDMAALSEENIAAINAKALKGLGTGAISALSNDQIAALTTAQINALEAWQVAAFGTAGRTPHPHRGRRNAGPGGH